MKCLLAVLLAVVSSFSVAADLSHVSTRELLDELATRLNAESTFAKAYYSCSTLPGDLEMLNLTLVSEWGQSNTASVRLPPGTCESVARNMTTRFATITKFTETAVCNVSILDNAPYVETYVFTPNGRVVHAASRRVDSLASCLTETGVVGGKP